jgi:hypothetical protein
MNDSLTSEVERSLQEREGTFRREQQRDRSACEAVIGYAQLQAGRTVRVKSKIGFESLIRGKG